MTDLQQYIEHEIKVNVQKSEAYPHGYAIVEVLSVQDNKLYITTDLTMPDGSIRDYVMPNEIIAADLDDNGCLHTDVNAWQDVPPITFDHPEDYL